VRVQVLWFTISSGEKYIQPGRKLDDLHCSRAVKLFPQKQNLRNPVPFPHTILYLDAQCQFRHKMRSGERATRRCDIDMHKGHQSPSRKAFIYGRHQPQYVFIRRYQSKRQDKNGSRQFHDSETQFLNRCRSMTKIANLIVMPRGCSTTFLPCSIIVSIFWDTSVASLNHFFGHWETSNTTVRTLDTAIIGSISKGTLFTTCSTSER
jgi:hypothetical protein